MSTHKSEDNKLGLLSIEAPPAPELTAGIQLKEDTKIQVTDEAFVLAHSSEKGQNVALLDTKLSNVVDGYITRARSETKETIGFILNVPHHLRLELIGKANNDKLPLPEETQAKLPLPEETSSEKSSMTLSYASGLTTHLCVHREYRDQGLAMALIRGLVCQGFTNKVYTGYHYIGTGRTLSQVPVKSWYRPLNVKEAAKAGYTLVVPSIKGIKDHGRVAAIMYKTEVKHKYRPTRLADFTALHHRKVSLDVPTEMEWNRLKQEPFIWRTFCGAKGPLLVGCYRPFPIRKGTETIKAAQLVYVEIAAGLDKIDEVLASFIGFIAGDGYIVLHGTEQGPLVGNSDKLKLIRTDTMFLDFYNLNIGAKTGPEDVSLLYI